MTILKTRVLLSIVCAFVLAGCLNAKGINKQVAKQYNGNLPEQKKKQNDVISISSPLITSDNQISTDESKTSHVLPLLVYWSLDYNNTCTLNPQIPINNFSQTVLANKALKAKLSGQKLELSVDSIPNKFAIDDKSHMVWLLLYAYSWDNISIKSDDMSMIVSYRILNGGQETKKGIITIPYSSTKTNLGMFKSWKKATSEYLDEYDANITQMSKMVADKLNKET